MVASLNGRVQQLESQLLAAQRQAQQQAQQTGHSSVTHEVKVCQGHHLSRLHLGVHLQPAHSGEGSRSPHNSFGELDSLVGAQGSSGASWKAAAHGSSLAAVFGQSPHTLAAAQQQSQGHQGRVGV